MKNKKYLFIGAGLFLVLSFVLGTSFYKNYESKRLGFLAQGNASLFVRDYSPQYGSRDAKVFITEFLDPECESCRSFHPQVKQLLEEYKGKVKLVVRYAAFHKNSKIAIAVLEASRKQGKYWESLDLLFKYQPRWGNHHNPQPNLIFDYLPEIGINVEQLRKDMEDPQIQKIIDQDASDLKELKVRGTPTFFVNGKPLQGFGLQFLREAIELEVKKSYTLE